MRWTSLIALAFAALMLGVVGCSKTPTVQDVCEKLASADEVADCTEEITRELGQCQNADDVLKCMGDAENESQAEDCFSQCQTGEGE